MRSVRTKERHKKIRHRLLEFLQKIRIEHYFIFENISKNRLQSLYFHLKFISNEGFVLLHNELLKRYSYTVSYPICTRQSWLEAIASAFLDGTEKFYVVSDNDMERAHLARADTNLVRRRTNWEYVRTLRKIKEARGRGAIKTLWPFIS